MWVQFHLRGLVERMCVGCWQEYGAPQIDTPKVREIAEAIAAVYEWNGVGGNLHIQIDDFNLDDQHFEGDTLWDTPLLKSCGNIWADDPDWNDAWKEAEERCYLLLKNATVEERASALALHDQMWGV